MTTLLRPNKSLSGYARPVQLSDSYKADLKKLVEAIKLQQLRGRFTHAHKNQARRQHRRARYPRIKLAF